MTDGRPYDVLVLGEVLVELSSPHSLSEGRDFKPAARWRAASRARARG